MKYFILFLFLFSSLAWGDGILDTRTDFTCTESLQWVGLFSGIDNFQYVKLSMSKKTKGFSFNGAVVYVNSGDVVVIDPPDENGIRKVTIERN